MLSNVTKSADVLRGATEMQDLWVEVEKETPVKVRTESLQPHSFGRPEGRT